MAGFGDSMENYILNAVLRGSSLPTINSTLISLHTADPGEAGTVGEIVGGGYARGTVTWGVASGGAATVAAAVDFDNMPAGTITYFGLWSGATPNLFIGGGTITNQTFAGGETARVTTATTFSLD